MTSALRNCFRLINVPLSRTYSAAAGDVLAKVDFNLKTGVAVVSMHRPPVNSLNLDLLEALGKTLDGLEESGKCRGMVLTSESPTVFSAGLDIMEMYKPNPERVSKFWKTLQSTWMKLYGSSFPTVAAINGHSPAGGCLLALSCEYRVLVGPKNTIGLNETKLGIIAPKWFMDCMRNVIGERRAELALTTGRMFTADEAVAAGLVDELATDKEDALARAHAFLQLFTNVPGMARAYTKKGFREETLGWLEKNQEKDLQIFLNYVNQPKVQQGLELYLQSLKKK